jgi:hypothetical protein
LSPGAYTEERGMCDMTFQLFKKIRFKVTDPIALIEAFCFQSDFYANYDAVPIQERKIQHVNRLGARIDERLLPKCQTVLENIEKLQIFKYDDDLAGLLKLDTDEMDDVVREFNEKAIKGLINRGIGLSKATKTLHTFHPETVPMIDNPLQRLYLKKINCQWGVGDPQIFIDYYQNFKEGNTWDYLGAISEQLQESNLALTRVRVFDILWWSCLKSKNLNARLKKEQRGTINWLTLQVEDFE